MPKSKALPAGSPSSEARSESRHRGTPAGKLIQTPLNHANQLRNQTRNSKMNRFKTSKFHNASPKPAKRENCYLDLHIGNLKVSGGNFIKASTSHLAFNVEHGGGGSLGVLSLDHTGHRNGKPPHLMHCHTDFVTDMDFSPFDERRLATCSYDCTIKLWEMPEHGDEESPEPIVVLPQQTNRVENVLYHPSASDVLASTCSKTLTVWDLQKQQEKYTISDHQDVIQSVSWKADGSLLATSSKDKKIRIFDPRTSTCAGEGNGLGGIRDSRIIWLGNRDHILGTGFSMSRERRIAVWDIHSLNSPLEYVDIDSSTGILMPFYDPDSDMLLLAGKGDSSIAFFEIKEQGNPYLCQVSGTMTEGQTKGMAMVPKAALDVMSCEVSRLLQVTQHSIVPISFFVPRRSYKEFHADLFPDTFGDVPAMTCQEWYDGKNAEREKISLDPSKRASSKCPSKDLQQCKAPTKPSVPDKPFKAETVKPSIQKEPKETKTSPSQEELPASTKKSFTGVRVSKFRHIHGTPLHKKNNIENIRNLSMSTFGECDGLLVNKEFVVWLVAGPGGQVAVHPLSNPCRLPDSGMPVIQCGSTIMDFTFDPFNDHRMAVACDTGVIGIWQIPQGGLTEIIDKPVTRLIGHKDKPTIVRYHPIASNLLASASLDLSIKLWDLEAEECVITLQGHEEQIFSFCWSLDGKHLASMSRDKKIRIYDPRAKTTHTKIGNGPEGTRGCRITWAGHEGEYLAVSGFDRTSERCLTLYSVTDLSSPVHTISMSVAPSILIPYYDEDTGVLLLSGKGDTIIYGFEISTENPYLFEISHYRTTQPFQAVGFLDKRACDVREVEIARAVQLNKANIEHIKFTVPRVKLEYFQDDIFPDTRVKWEAALSCHDWLAGKNKELKKLSLRPQDMKPLSEAPKETKVVKKYNSGKELDSYKSDEQKKEELVTAMVDKLGNFEDDPLPQDMMEGVDDDEWDD